MLGKKALTTQHIGKFAARDDFNKFEKCQAPGFESLLISIFLTVKGTIRHSLYYGFFRNQN